MKKKFLKAAALVAILSATSYMANAQQKFGDNLGNHKATKDLNMNTQKIVNASGVAIGTATLVNGSVALQIDGSDKAILIPRVANNTDIVTPVNGMIIYNTTADKFFMYQAGAWSTFALALRQATGINDDPLGGSDAGYELTQSGQETVLTLSAATASKPGVVSTTAQEFGGNKTFNGNVVINGANLTVLGSGATTLGGTLNVGGVTTLDGNTSVTGTSTFTVGTGATTLGGTLDAAGAAKLASTLEVEGTTTLKGNTSITDASTLTVGTGATTLGGTLEVAGTTTLNGNASVTGTNTLTVGTGATTLGGTLTVADATDLTGTLTVGTTTANKATTLNGTLTVTGASTATGDESESILVIDQTTGEVRKSNLVANALDKKKVVIPTVTLATNEAVKVVLTGIVNLKKNDGIVVNFDADDLAATADLTYMTILNATATADGEVTVTVADMRQEPETGSLTDAGVVLTGKHFTVTRYHAAN